MPKYKLTLVVEESLEIEEETLWLAGIKGKEIELEAEMKGHNVRLYSVEEVNNE